MQYSFDFFEYTENMLIIMGPKGNPSTHGKALLIILGIILDWEGISFSN